MRKLLLLKKSHWVIENHLTAWFGLNQRMANTVHSAYWMVLAREEANQPSSSRIKENTIWCKIWKLSIPSKIKHFLWRALINSLPTKMNLKKRGVQVWEVCDRCGVDRGHKPYPIALSFSKDCVGKQPNLELGLQITAPKFWGGDKFYFPIRSTRVTGAIRNPSLVFMVLPKQNKSEWAW